MISYIQISKESKNYCWETFELWSDTQNNENEWN